MNLEQGFRRTTVVVSVGLLVASLGLAALIGPDAARSAEREAARAVLFGDGDLRAGPWVLEQPELAVRNEIVRHVLLWPTAEEILGLTRSAENLKLVTEYSARLETRGLVTEARRAARLARAQSWATTAAAVFVITLLPWGAFFVVRWIVHGFLGDRRGRVQDSS